MGNVGALFVTSPPAKRIYVKYLYNRELTRQKKNSYKLTVAPSLNVPPYFLLNYILRMKSALWT